MQYSDAVSNALKDKADAKTAGEMQDLINTGLKKQSKTNPAAKELLDSKQTIKIICFGGKKAKELGLIPPKDFQTILDPGLGQTKGDFDKKGKPKKNGIAYIAIDCTKLKLHGWNTAFELNLHSQLMWDVLLHELLHATDKNRRHPPDDIKIYEDWVKALSSSVTDADWRKARRAARKRAREAKKKLKDKRTSMGTTGQKFYGLRGQYEDALKGCPPREKEVVACKSPVSTEAIALGPKSEIGSGVAKIVEEAAEGLIGGALGGLFGGGGVGGGFGGGDLADQDVEDDTNGLPIKDDPIENKTTLTDPATGIKLRMGGKVMDNGNLLVSTEIVDAPGKGTFHGTNLVDKNCRRMKPKEIIPYGLYQDWSLSVQITTTTNYYQDGQLVRTETHTSPWETIGSGTNYLGSGFMTSEGDNGEQKDTGIWQAFGFNRATEGVNSLGSKFSTSMLDLKYPLLYQTWVTLPAEDPVLATPITSVACPRESGDVEFRLLPRIDKGGGMTRIDPPENLELLNEDIGEVDSVIDELQPYTFGAPPVSVDKAAKNLGDWCPELGAAKLKPMLQMHFKPSF